VVLPFIIAFSNYYTVYFIGSRSLFGFLRQLPFLAVAILKKKRLINHLHGADFKDFYINSGFIKPLIYWVYSHINTAIILLEPMRDQFDNFPELKLQVVPNAVGKDFENLNIKFPKSKQVLYLSNVMASKGIIEFLTAAKQLLKRDKSIIIAIAGTFLGDFITSKKEIKSTFYTLYEPLKKSYPNRIHYYGTVRGQKKLDLLKSSSIFILPTYYPTEAFPIAILEAMATGNAIITTSHNYLEHIISKDNGVIIPIKEKNEIVRNIEQLFNDGASLEIIQKANHEVSKNFTVDSYLVNIEKIVLNE
jgi:glycosyltransferase involved in cell wall biosynthesis